jgi:NADH-quinone oxidoreductase subunit L
MTDSLGGQLIVAAIPALPILSFIVLVFFGRYLGENAQYVSVFAVASALVFAVTVLASVAGWMDRLGIPAGNIDYAVPWIQLGDGGAFPMGVYVDPLAAVMLVVVCFVSLMVQLFSGGFMEGHQRFAWYYAVASIFTASMLGLVVSSNFIQLYLFWELVGATSYLIHGFFFERPAATYAALKAFIVNRVADTALFIGIIIFWRQTGTTSFTGIADAARSGFMSDSMLTVALLMVLLGCAGKSAQFPLHVWLSNAMNGPTPLSALIHAAAMIVSGVYLVARTYDIFVQSPAAMLTVAYVGAISAFMAATMALVQKDIKQVIAYSTISQFGYIMLALGVGAYSAGVFHIFNHAFFKALLFLIAGSLGYVLASYKFADMGGLRRRMPITFWVMVIAGLSLAGVFPFSGFWSKEAIVSETLAGGHYVLFVLAVVTILLTAFYIFRAIFMTFGGEPKSDAARGAVEVPGVMAVPMIALAALSIGSGWVGLPGTDWFGGFVAPSEFATGALGLESHPFNYLMAIISTLMALAGIGLAYVLCVRSPALAESLAKRLPRTYRFLENGWYFDTLYDVLFVRSAKRIARAVGGFDRRVIRGSIEGLSRGVGWSGERLRGLQGGGVQSYALFLLLGALAIGVIAGAQGVVLVAGLVAIFTVAVIAVGVRL